MAKIEQLKQHQHEQQRLALLALLADRPRPTGQCPSDETLAAFVDGKLGQAEVGVCLAHLADCEHCMQIWLQLDHHWHSLGQDDKDADRRPFFARPKVLATAGSLLAVAASIAVFITITTRMDQGLLLHQRLDQIPSTATLPQERGEEKLTAEPAPPAPATSTQPAKPQPAATSVKPMKKADLSVPQEAVFAQKRREKGEKMSEQEASKMLGAESTHRDRNFLAREAGTALVPATTAQAPEPTPMDEAATPGPMNLETWEEELRLACEQPPTTKFPARFMDQGRRLLKDQTLEHGQQALVKSLLEQLERDEAPGQSCPRILKLLEHKKPAVKQ